jgi:UDP-N-acetylglucosamine 2-epimerase (non-hydrolysing)
VFFRDLDLPQPDVNLEVGSGSHAWQTAQIMVRLEEFALERRPDWVLVYGDVNSTVAAALVCSKRLIPVGHVEAGLRSFDRTMPEEINRLLTDAVADCLLVSEPSGVENLKREGVAEERIHLVGNVMIDTLLRELNQPESLVYLEKRGLPPQGYGLVTLHRPSNVDDPNTLSLLLQLLEELSRELPLILPIHPRTRQAARQAGLERMLNSSSGFRVVDPVPYRESLALISQARLVLTDSGGMQEETSVLKVPCLTLRENTERPITLELGTSRLVGNDPERIRRAFADALGGRWPKGEEIPFWDGRAAERIAEIIVSMVEGV